MPESERRGSPTPRRSRNRSGSLVQCPAGRFPGGRRLPHGPRPDTPSQFARARQAGGRARDRPRRAARPARRGPRLRSEGW
ncbi:hypothetical protein E0L36_18305 [Streptomyces sp. AJS327]|nr:hypothetical protein [Streptomyces sp. AJS327]